MSTRSSVPPESLWTDLASDLGTSTLQASAAAPSSATTTVLSWLWSWVALLRGLTLAAGTAASAAVAAVGFALLMYLITTASLAPASDTFSRTLPLDFSQADLVAEAVFLPQAQLRGDGLLPANVPSDARFLAPSQPVDVWVELEVPRGTAQGVAQVVAQLTSMDGRVAAKASRAVYMHTDCWSLRSLSTAPLRWLGLASNVRRLRVPLFTNYHEKREVPFQLAQVAIKTRNPHWAAEVLSATVKVQLRLGLFRRAIYLLRPGRLLLLLLGCGALGAMVGGGLAALVCLGLLLYAGLGGGLAVGTAGGIGGGEEEMSVASEEEVEVSSVSGVSEASSSLLRELEEEEGEPPSPRHHPGMPTAGRGAPAAGTGAAPAAAVAAELWQDALSEGATTAGTSASAAGAASPRGVVLPGSGQQPLRKAAAAGAGGPADSAMGSEGGYGDRAAAALRRRAGGSGSAKPTSSL